MKNNVVSAREFDGELWVSAANFQQEVSRLHAVNKELLKTLKWLDNWMGEKPLIECSRRVGAALAAARQSL